MLGEFLKYGRFQLREPREKRWALKGDRIAKELCHSRFFLFVDVFCFSLLDVVIQGCFSLLETCWILI
jgi:hypothetical protein